LGGAGSDAGAPAIAGAALAPAAFRELPGWAADRHADALRTLAAGAPAGQPLRAVLPTPQALGAVLAEAARLSTSMASDAAARAFFERHFQPFRISLAAGRGFMTGYFEPEFEASLAPSGDFPTPLYGRPPDLVTADGGVAADPPAGWPAGLQAARRLPDGRLAAFPDRRAIDAAPIGSLAPVVAWMRDPVDRFVMQVQGSARLKLPDGAVVRAAYAGRNGHPYVSLGRLVSQREGIPPAEMTMDRLVARLKSDPDANRRLIGENTSFVFFRLAAELGAAEGPIGGAGVPLTPDRSLAADRTIWPYHLPMWLSGALPTAERGVDRPLARLMIVQDTGSAIIGPARFDYFHGAGPAAGFVAGLTRHAVDAVVLWPMLSPRGGG
jgi:membrane-bound lytic murein transglycosylase A